MARKWCVVLKGRPEAAPWGDFDDKGTAEEFALYLTAEVDPAEVKPLQNPVRDLLGWRRGVALPAIAGLRDDLARAEGTPAAPIRIQEGHAPGCTRQGAHFFPQQCGAEAVSGG
jgi:hypothetical protein